MTWMPSARGAVSLLLGLCLALTACRDAGRPGSAATAGVPSSAPVDATAEIALGRKVYNFRCYFCHGYSGDAKTLAATYLSPAPRDFTRAQAMSRAEILDAVRRGRDGTAMKPFAAILSDAEIRAVAAFVEREFLRERARNTVYHSAENGWPGHRRYAAAYPFATGAILLDADPATLDPEQLRGRRLFLSACVSCHDRGHVADEGPAWSARPLSYPRMGFVPGQQSDAQVDAVSSASVYAKHDVAPAFGSLDARERLGQDLFQANCAFCHGADGTGKNWIGQFMEPKARDLTAYAAHDMPPARLRERIRDGLPGTSMPAWRSVLTEAQIDAVAAYVGRLMRGSASQPEPAGG